MLRIRLMTAGAAAALMMAPAAFAQDQPASNPPNVGEVPETEVNASAPRPNPGEDSAPPAPTQPWAPETPSENAVLYNQADDEGWSEPDGAPPAGEAATDVATETEAAPDPDPLPPADPLEPPADSTVPPPPIDPAPDAGLEDDDPLDPEPPGA